MQQKDRICETALRMFTGAGYSGVTMEQIARGCGVGKATLYKHFASKRELLMGCVEYFTAKIGAQVERIVSDPSLPLAQKLSQFIVPVARFASGISPAVLDDIRRSAPEAYERIDENRKRLIFANITRIVEEGKRQGEFRADVDSRLVAHILVGAVSHIATPPVLEELGLPVGRLLDAVLAVVWNGCRAGAESGRIP